ncbi:MAG: hypothetical protein JXQ65_13350 [Candidatus Marinimicrobia bacterium]|nr:hypothetical protein [Candidatus Neomarinimicrobiota bacterium]
MIRNFKPFQDPETIDSILMGNDLDAILSAQFLCDRFGWKIAGLYDLENIWHDGKVDIRQKIREQKIVAIDLDIYHRSIPSLGHHILQLKPTDNLTGFRNSINPNLVRNRTKENFRWKYPLGTIHFLRWFFEDYRRDDEFEMLCWLADSTFINAQKYRRNVGEWLDNFLSVDYFKQYFLRTGSLEFEQKIQEVVLPKLSEIKLDNTTAMTQSKHLKINGFQTRIRDVNHDRSAIKKLLNYISQISGMKIPDCPARFDKIPGLRTNMNLEKVLNNYKNFDDFLLQENIFSYALTYKNILNFTKFDKK